MNRRWLAKVLKNPGVAEFRARAETRTGVLPEAGAEARAEAGAVTT